MSIFGSASDFASEVAAAAAEVEKAAPPAPDPEPAAPEPEVEAPQAEPVAAPPSPAPQPQPEPEQKTVPLAALHQERQERQKLERDFNDLQQAFAQFQRQIQQQAEPQEDPLSVDPSADPYTALVKLQQEVQQWRASRQQEAETNQIKTAYLGSIQQAVTADPTFKDAYNHLVQSRLTELTAAGMPMHQANETIKQEEIHLARTAFASGRNPADVVIGYAKARGFAPKQPEPPPPPPPAPAEQVQQQAAKTAAATSLAGGGRPPKADLSVNDIAGLQGAAFDAAWDKLAKNAVKTSGLFRH